MRVDCRIGPKFSVMSPAGRHFLIVIAGPTAVGKTDLAIRLASQFGTEIISADSRQFYREMNIGTAKPDPQQLMAVKHHFINSHSVDELYGAGHFARDAEKLIAQLFSQHKTLIMAGGSGLYIHALLEGVDDFGDENTEIRQQIVQQYQANGLAWLQEQVNTRDPGFYKTADINNPQRLMRALEVCMTTGQPYSGFLNKNKTEKTYVVIPILVNLPRELLYARINQRVEQMMEAGLYEEVLSLKQHMHLNALKTVGYREIEEHLAGKCSLAEAVEKIKQHTRNYAKRQITWFRNKASFAEFDIRDEATIIAHIKKAMT